MPIPKIIHQTFKTSKLPFLTRWHIARLRRRNPDYQYEFYDDDRITKFLHEEFPPEVYNAYEKINIGAAKADFFRYAILYKKGGVYLDIDCCVNSLLDDFIRTDDTALLSFEKDPVFYVQWAMIYTAGHPFLKKTIEMVLENIEHNKYPHDVHKMTGPYVYTQAINNCLKDAPSIAHRIFGIEYGHHLRDKYKLAKFILYKDKKQHWKKLQLISTVLKADHTSSFSGSEQQTGTY